MADTDVPVRPEIIGLNESQRDRIRTELNRRRATCAACGSRDFTVGDALYIGFLFTNEDPGTHMVALTCTNDDCPDPRTGIRLQRDEFLDG